MKLHTEYLHSKPTYPTVIVQCHPFYLKALPPRSFDAGLNSNCESQIENGKKSAAFMKKYIDIKHMLLVPRTAINYIFYVILK